ncbi:MAG: 3-hydroxybutyryl-CoA dehydrogenase [Chloroflexia bacterium]|jgi:3-hydroxybutyryl-CoA dehydrogenase|nr:3-hydroxybutyryl-CoA dehydrogenase [Chloroflexia bacterium]
MSGKIAVLGAGTMGAGIAQLAAQSGFEVVLYDIKDDFVQRGLNNIRGALQGRVDKGKMSQDEMHGITSRIATTTSLEETASANFIIEAAPEDIELKREIFSTLGRHSPRDTILASNTSSLSITSIAAATERPETVVGMHFFNPAPVMPLVEVIGGAQTSPEVRQSVAQLARDLGKTPVLAADSPGFIVNRVARPFYGEALKMLGEGFASVEQIDAAMRAAGFRMGPFELMDLIGIDINFAVTKSVYEAFFGEPRYRPHPIQQRMVEGGTLGRKTGRGFYVYENGEKSNAVPFQLTNIPQKRAVGFVPTDLVRDFLTSGGIVIEDEVQAEVSARILAMIINEASFAVGEGVATIRDIDTAMRLGTNYPKGPLRWADEIGLDKVMAVLNNLRDSLGEERYRPSPLLWQLVKSGVVGDAVGEGFHTPGEKGMV